MSNKVNRKDPTEAQKILALILAVVMVLGMVLPALLWLV